MAAKREKPEEIVSKLRQVELLQGQGATIAEAARQISSACAGKHHSNGPEAHDALKITGPPNRGTPFWREPCRTLT
jgi:hypothetical protein